MTEAIAATLQRLTRLHPKLIDLSLDRITRLLGAIGNPEAHLPPVVHVAGTNGKGSVVAFVRSIAEAAGLDVHAYISPHLVRFNERITLAGTEIDDDALAAVLNEVETVNDGAPITFFEITTCAALLAFARTPADLLVMETGLGGRLDTTNIVAQPRLTAITPVSLDHQDFLGNDLASIAGEKAGIFKPGVDGIVAHQPAPAMMAIEARAAELGVSLFRRGVDWDATSTAEGMRYEGTHWRVDLPRPSLFGPHQIDNAGQAVACAERLEEMAISETALADGVRTARWPARLQRLTAGPLLEALPAGWELWLDGGHNASAGEALAETARQWAAADRRPLLAVVGMLAKRDPAVLLRPLRPFITDLRGVTVPDQENVHDARGIVARAAEAGLMAQPAESVAEALASLAAAHQGPARVLICGTLYLAGWVLRENR